MFYTTLTNLSTKYLVMCKVYTDVGGIKKLYHVCPPVRKIIHSLKLVDYLHVHADNPWYNYYVFACNAQPTVEILLGLQFNDLPDGLVQKHIEPMFLDSFGLSSWIHYIEDL